MTGAPCRHVAQPGLLFHPFQVMSHRSHLVEDADPDGDEGVSAYRARASLVLGALRDAHHVRATVTSRGTGDRARSRVGGSTRVRARAGRRTEPRDPRPGEPGP